MDKAQRWALGVLLTTLLGLGACIPSDAPQADPAPAAQDWLRDASTEPPYMEVVGEGTTLAFAGSVEVPASVPADAESRARWFLDEHGEAFGVDDADADTVVRSIDRGPLGTPEEGDSLVTFDRVVGGVPVYGSSIRIEVADSGVVTIVMAETPSDPDVDPNPTVDRDAAMQSARAQEPGTMATDATLAIYDEAMLRGARGPSRLVWIVDLVGAGGNAPVRFVDAHDGELLPWRSSTLLEARDRLTSTMASCASGATQPVYLESGLLPGTTPTADATAAHELVGQVWQYYKSTFLRDSYDGLGGTIISTTDYTYPEASILPCNTDGDCQVLDDPCGTARCVDDGDARYCQLTADGRACGATQFCDVLFACTSCSDFPNAHWDGHSLTFGRGLVVDDVVAHEFTHAVVQTTAGLVYQGESGALNESMADVFAHGVDSEDWLIAEDSTLGTIRDSAHPGDYHQPSHVDQLDLDPDNLDFGGVHANNAIPSLAAYLAAEGGVHPYSGVEVRGIGFDRVQQVWFRALSWYMTSGSTFIGARLAIRLAAWKYARRNMYGMSYRDCGSILDAFAAVGIGAPDSDGDCYDDAIDSCPDEYRPDPVWDYEQQTCVRTCNDVGGFCGGSGPEFDDQCCGDAICVVGACEPPDGGRERDDCAERDCALGLACGPVGTADAAPTCCARDSDYCESKDDCCGMMDCLGNQCVGRTSGQACMVGDCLGASFCDAGVCT